MLSRIYVVLILIPILSAALFAVDGVVLVDQNRALAGNVTPGDAPGFPVTINLPGSYRLMGNLTVPDAGTHAIQVNATDVTVDLNGFSIIGPVVCSGGGFSEPSLSCIGASTGRGITGGSGVTVTNGTIRGMGGHGIVLSENCRIEKVRLISNGLNGVSSLNGCVLTENTAMRNGQHGFFGQSGTFIGNTAYANAKAGFTCSNTCQISKGVASFNGEGGISAGGGSTVTTNSLISNQGSGIGGTQINVIGNTVLGTEGNGIFCQSCLVKDNLVRGSTGFGLQITIETGYAANVFQNNNGGNANPQIAPGVGSRNLGQNMCGTTLCP